MSLCRLRCRIKHFDLLAGILFRCKRHSRDTNSKNNNKNVRIKKIKRRKNLRSEDIKTFHLWSVHVAKCRCCFFFATFWFSLMWLDGIFASIQINKRKWKTRKKNKSLLGKSEDKNIDV
jgi:hypothetical protein